MLYLCNYHNYDRDHMGIRNTDPAITCQACRSGGYFTPQEVENYKKYTYRRVAIYSRPLGYPETLNVVLNESDSLFEAERIAPHGSFKLDGVRLMDPDVHSDNNTKTLQKPPDGQTLQDVRGTWDPTRPEFWGSEKSKHQRPQVYIVNITPAILSHLETDYDEILRFSPEEFEIFVLDRLLAMGFEGQRIGRTHAKDGGIDIVFWPRAGFAVPFLAAAQVKHHRVPTRKTTAPDVREFIGALNHPFLFGLVVTNTSFTADARWVEEKRGGLVRLRDMEALRRWISGDFTSTEDWRLLPRQIEISRGVHVDLTVGNLILPEP